MLEQKAVLDQEVTEKVGIVSDKLITAYNIANGKVEALEAELGGLQNRVNSNLPEDETDLIRIPVGDTFFYGTEVFAPELENYANSGRAYDDYFQELQAHISEYEPKVSGLLASVKALKDGTSEFYGEIEKVFRM